MIRPLATGSSVRRGGPSPVIEPVGQINQAELLRELGTAVEGNHAGFLVGEPAQEVGCLVGLEERRPPAPAPERSRRSGSCASAAWCPVPARTRGTRTVCRARSSACTSQDNPPQSATSNRRGGSAGSGCERPATYDPAGRLTSQVDRRWPAPRWPWSGWGTDEGWLHQQAVFDGYTGAIEAVLGWLEPPTEAQEQTRGLLELDES